MLPHLLDRIIFKLNFNIISVFVLIVKLMYKSKILRVYFHMICACRFVKKMCHIRMQYVLYIWRNLLIVFLVPTILTIPKCVCVLFFLLFGINVVLLSSVGNWYVWDKKASKFYWVLYWNVYALPFSFHVFVLYRFVLLYFPLASFYIWSIRLDLTWLRFNIYSETKIWNRAEQRERERARDTVKSLFLLCGRNLPR